MRFLLSIIFISIFIISPVVVHAIYDPTSVPNNKVGIHILFPSEVQDANNLINNKGDASWGYITIPIQSGDRDRKKWQNFLDDCKKNKLIPIIRVATVPDGANWVKPNSFDVIDFANFLGDLQWPTQNRYIVIFNEVNRSDEFGGYVNPEEYADILCNSSDIFKAKSQEFFILPAGLDNAASNGKKSMNPRNYLERMILHRIDLLDKIDGWTSHAYPNPAFSSRPDQSGINKVNSYASDLRLIHQFTTKKFPVFITETGWSTNNLSDHQISLYYKYVMEKVWNNPDIVAITPFLLDAKDGPFVQFSFMGINGQPKEFASIYSSFAISGSPLMASDLPPVVTPIITTTENTSTSSVQTEPKQLSVMYIFKKLFTDFSTVFGLFPKN